MEFDVKSKVKEYYGGFASQINSKGSKSSCCSCNCADIEDIVDIKSNYNGQDLSALPTQAIEASLGCANPLLFAKLKEGETVLDLGSGGGIDVLLASRYVGETGKVYGLDMTDEMLALANKNKGKMGVKNVEFLKGYIEEIPLANESVDVIMSNCVINLSEDKEKALAEAYRVIKPGGRLAIADIVNLKEVPEEIWQMAKLWVGCIAGALTVDEYKTILEKVGFKEVEIKPAHVYTKSVIEELIKAKGIDFKTDINLDTVDGAFAGSFITAKK